jgi:hypothetical protein
MSSQRTFLVGDGRSAVPPPLWPRRHFVASIAMALALPTGALCAGRQEYPEEVAGIRLPRTRLCVDAYKLCRSAAPSFLLNHCMRTYLFGALHAEHHHQAFDAETAFAAALLHDLGLLATFASKTGPFEIDGADGAEMLVRAEGGSAGEARGVWNAIVMHDMRFAIALHQSTEATLVAAGAGADVIGPDPDTISAAAVGQVVAAFPRLQFKRAFIALVADHCRRKPGAQSGTWLEGFCRQHSTFPTSGTERAILAAPFNE